METWVGIRASGRARRANRGLLYERLTFRQVARGLDNRIESIDRLVEFGQSESGEVGEEQLAVGRGFNAVEAVVGNEEVSVEIGPVDGGREVRGGGNGA